MAAWLLRSSRLGALKFDSWGSLRRYPLALFCSEAKEPVKPVKNAKDPDKSEDERAAMWTYKTAVAFPVKLSDPGVLPPFLGVTKEPVRFTATSEKAAAAASVAASTKSAGEKSSAVTASSDLCQSQEEGSQILAHDTLPVFVAAEEASVEELCKGSVPGDVPALAVSVHDVVKPTMVSARLGDSAAEELSSSSSSDSDTDSDSDSDSESIPEDENLEVETETRSFSLELQQPGLQEQREIKELIVSGVAKGLPSAEEAADQSVVQASTDNLRDSAFDVLTATKNAAELTSSDLPTHTAPADTLCEAPAVPVEQHEAPDKAQSNSPLKAVDALTELEQGLGDAGEESCGKTSTIGAVQSKAVSAEVAADHPAEVAADHPAEVAADHPAEVGTSVELEDSAQVLVEATGEELHAETPAERPEESAAVPPEPFDNSTYKNYQHHSYTSFTFADLDVEMAKYRLPQPSSGRPSPRH
ncbi:nucleolin 2 isoform X2 [Poecilia latipinna]|uniref:nucleolin 2 isoform X2 n=1 Tax=Poecilia latipinna TaxID=48699 RepID=UPI00072ED84F|nr:PREDICTED: NADH dehydrogenase [ubiquinone] flavoprotein 3, mitochondrial isoform X2 [Poecilia latipinna]